LTRLEDEYPDVANVHVSAVEHKDRIVFLHTVEHGPASRSYGIQVAQLAGVPQPVIKTARKQLAKLERDAVANSPQRDLFSEAASVTPDSHPVLDVLEALDPDSMSPKQALEAVYELKSRLRNQPDDDSDHSG
jgi:DNA mismatch repair protein MutS